MEWRCLASEKFDQHCQCHTSKEKKKKKRALCLLRLQAGDRERAGSTHLFRTRGNTLQRAAEVRDLTVADRSQHRAEPGALARLVERCRLRRPSHHRTVAVLLRTRERKLSAPWPPGGDKVPENQSPGGQRGANNRDAHSCTAQRVCATGRSHFACSRRRKATRRLPVSSESGRTGRPCCARIKKKKKPSSVREPPETEPGGELERRILVAFESFGDEVPKRGIQRRLCRPLQGWIARVAVTRRVVLDPGRVRLELGSVDVD